ncbi:MmcB family DNA repair protein, partial [Marinobacter aromaticivorans]
LSAWRIVMEDIATTPCSTDAVRPVVTDSVTRGVLRFFMDLGFAPMTEIPLTNGRRVDVLALDRRGKAVIVEVKSSVADYRADRKWTEYLDYCEEFYFAVDASFPRELFDESDSLPETVGVIVADSYGADILRPAAVRPVNAARRKTLTLRMARAGAQRLSSQMIGRP